MSMDLEKPKQPSILKGGYKIKMFKNNIVAKHYKSIFSVGDIVGVSMRWLLPLFGGERMTWKTNKVMKSTYRICKKKDSH
jgi:hypothetical protein